MCHYLMARNADIYPWALLSTTITIIIIWNTGVLDVVFIVKDVNLSIHDTPKQTLHSTNVMQSLSCSTLILMLIMVVVLIITVFSH